MTTPPPARPLRRARRLWRDSEASAQVVAFLVGGSIFVATLAGLLLAARGTSTDSDPAATAAQGLAAASLADIVIGSSGVGWGSDPDTLSRLGLASSNGSGLDPTRIQALRGAVAESTDNGKVDYDDALESLGLDPDGTAGFHLRIYPVGLDELEVSEDLRIGYIADWTSLVSVSVALPVGSSESMAVKANVQLNQTMAPTTALERAALRSLGADFNDRVFITVGYPTILVDYTFPLPDLPLLTVLNLPLLEGDVYPDHKGYLEGVLAPRLSQYDVIVVGSGVDHGNLVKNEIKDGIKTWVQGGGTLIALGSADKSTAWLNPLLNVGVSTVNGAAVAPDVAHPLLKQPNDLAWTSYESHDLGWDIQEGGAVGAYDDFSHVIIQDGEDVLTVSKQGAFGDGRVILTTFLAREVATGISQAEANAFLENMVSYGDRSSLYLDYGGTLPADQAVALAVRQSWIWDEVYGPVPVRVEVLSWA